uniref:Glutamyl-tRNA(Gln) amidotransferase subunit B, mitochondrial n=1 Tax=Phallusia mammillata TaxID=59560 RepID=A0A6F9DP21_9ASCI|nr:glutamyl-tRNA(Gln) amidotransferase subunit B, mitochondrial-like [Phallusia mammillata]
MLTRIRCCTRAAHRYLSSTQADTFDEWKKYADESNLSPMIGLEIHAQINSTAKLFSGSENKFMAPTNSLVSNYDASVPGTLPVLNKRCVEAAVYTALALNCKLNMQSQFDRKHYFYADTPQGYQITQQRCPIAVNGTFSFPLSSGKKVKTIHIQQIQLEQDSGKSLHDDETNHTYIDLNRANVGLLEIVTSPGLTGAEDTCAFVKELQMTLQLLGACDGKMQEGQLRVDLNLSMSGKDEKPGTRAEVKNISGISHLKDVIEYEIKRQVQILNDGGTVEQETRAYDSVKKVTTSMRDKEEAQDYRFMPEPNLPPLTLYNDETAPKNTDRNFINVDELKRKMPIIPGRLREILMQRLGLQYKQAEFLLEKQLASFYRDVLYCAPDLSPTLVYNWMRIKLVALQHTSGFTASESGVTAQELADLLTMEQNHLINQSQSKEAFELALTDVRSPVQIVKDNDWIGIIDMDVIRGFCDNAIAQLTDENPDFLKNLNQETPHTVIVRQIVGLVLKLSQGKAKRKLVTPVVISILKNLDSE